MNLGQSEILICTNEEMDINMEITDTAIISEEKKNEDFKTRCYQQELFESALKNNSILVLGTGSGKTFISIMLLKELGDTIRGIPSKGAKRTVFVVNTVPLVHQQTQAIGRHTPFNVGFFEGSLNVDDWSNEKWEEEINKHEVLVMVAEIFKNLILHNRLPLTKVNLIIMDECHHATGKHPMREIMYEYATLKSLAENDPTIELPRILGLSACVIHRKCKVQEVSILMKNLEKTMNCSLVTSKYQDIVQQHTTKPLEIVIEFQQSDDSSYNVVSDILNAVQEKILTYIKYKQSQYRIDRIQNKKEKFVKKLLAGILHSIVELGDFILHDAIKLEADYLRESDGDSVEEQDINEKLADFLLQALTQMPIIDKNDPLSHISNKVKRLFEILGLPMYSNESVDLRILVFVERRNTAKLLHGLLLDMKKFDPTFQFFNPECLVGGTTNMKSDLKVQQEIEKQKKVMIKFRKGECNIIFSTSVLEEGIDVQKCNAVIRFDKPKDFRSYVQSLGRARAVPSKYILLSKDAQVQKEEILFFKVILKHLLDRCHGRPMPLHEEVIESFKDNEEEEPAYVPYGHPGPKITFNSAIQVINKYCGSLPQDKFTLLSVSVRVEKVDKLVQIYLTLPRNAPINLRSPVVGNAKSCKEYAKKSAALALCKILHQNGELDKRLLPKKLKQDLQITKNLNIETEMIEQGKPQAGTRKRRQVYERRQCSHFNSDTKPMYLHYIDFEVNLKIFKNKDTKLGFLCAEPLSSCKFQLYCSLLENINVDVKYVPDYHVDDCDIEKIKHFHMVTYQLLLNLNKGMMTFEPENTHHSVLLVPMTSTRNIDIQVLESVSKFTSLSDYSNYKNSTILDEPFNFCSDEYIDAVIIPTYRQYEYYFVEEICFHLNPLSEFPEKKKRFGSYKEYFMMEYNREIRNNTQPLLRCRNFPKELNCNKVKPNSRKSKDNISHHPVFVPELCAIIPFSTSLWWQIIMVPSVLHRLNGLLLERELYNSIKYQSNPVQEYDFILKNLDYLWCEIEVKKNLTSLNDNLVISLKNKTEMSIYPGMILQALSPISAGDNFNLERLEVLGDSYLKFSVGVHLFLKETANHEGKLTLERSYIVSNKTLYTLAKAKNLPQLYQGFVLNRLTVIPYGFKILEDLEHIYFQPAETTEKEFCNNPCHLWKEQVIPDKCVADCIESLIGVYLLTGGEKAARHLMSWLGFTFLSESYPLPKTAFLGNDVLPIQVDKLYKKLCLDKLEEILQYKFRSRSFLIQAVTHPSDILNKLTDCYQRLEFLGDAVLDYLITGYIFAEFNKYDPGELTDLRSHFVKNETLAKSAVKLELNKYLLHGSPKLGTTINLFIDLVKEGEKDFTTEDDAVEAEDIEVPKALGDLVEAILGAIYIDSNLSLKACWNVIQILLKEEFILTKQSTPIDHVRALYERDPSVKFELIPPTEDTKASCIVTMEGFTPFTGTGKNQRTAKQAAAKLALFHLSKQSERL